MDTHKNRVSRAVGNCDALIEGNEVVSGPRLDHPQAILTKDPGHPLGGIEREDFFVIALVGTGAPVVSAMPGIEHHGIEKARRLMSAKIWRGAFARGEKNAREEATKNRQPKKTAQATRRLTPNVPEPISSWQHKVTLGI